MNAHFIDYRDPLFGIMAFLLLLSFVAIFWMVAAKIKERGEARRIKRFLRKFPANSQSGDYARLLEAYPESYELLLKVAKAHFDGGDYEKSLKVYLALLEWLSPFERAKRAQILENLGDIYIKSGFLQRSVDAYEQSLALVARNASALSKIANIYEKRGEYEKAIEALEALEEMGVDEGRRKEFAKGVLALKQAASVADRLIILGSIWRGSEYFAREYLKELLVSEQKTAALFLEQNMSPAFLDILWVARLDGESFKGAKNPLLLSVLSSKEVIKNECQESGIFELDALKVVNASGAKLKADLSFEFVCQKCGSLDIDYFFSCKCCSATNSCKIITSIVPKREDDMSFLESW